MTSSDMSNESECVVWSLRVWYPAPQDSSSALTRNTPPPLNPRLLLGSALAMEVIRWPSYGEVRHKVLLMTH